MKRYIQRTLYCLIFIVVITISSSCAVTLSDNHPPRHRHRTVWVSGVSYNQVYYIQNHNVVIVSQEPAPQKGKHGRHGKHKGH